MSNKHKQVTAYQASALLINATIGVGLLTLPRQVTHAARTGGWLSVIVLSAVAFLALYLYTLLGQRFGHSTLPEYTVKTMGLFLGGLICLTFASGWLLFVAIQSRLFAEIVVTSVLSQVELEVGLILMLLLAALLATQDVKGFARVNQFFLPFVVLALSLVIALSLTQVTFWRLLPPFGSGIREILSGSLVTATAFSGFELISLFMPFYTNPKEALKSHTRGIVLVALIYLLTVIVATGTFGVPELAKSQWPTLEMVRLIGFRGVLERLEAPFLSIYVIAVFTTAGANFFGAVLTLKQLFKLKTKEGWPYLFVPPLYYLAIRPQNIVELENVIRTFSIAWFGYILLVPIVLLLVAIARKEEDKPDEQPQGSA